MRGTKRGLLRWAFRRSFSQNVLSCTTHSSTRHRGKASTEMAAESITDQRAAAAPWREVVAGAIGAVVTIAVVSTLGMLGYAALGPKAAAVGIPAAFIATAIG